LSRRRQPFPMENAAITLADLEGKLAVFELRCEHCRPRRRKRVFQAQDETMGR
jgi:hypothetical protein